MESTLLAPVHQFPDSAWRAASLDTRARALEAHEQALRHLGDYGFVQFHPALAERYGHKAALFLGLALYWTRHTLRHQSHRKGWFYMTARQWRESVGLSGREQGTARALLIREGLLQESLAGRPAVLHFKIDLKKLSQILGFDATTIAPEAETHPLWCGNYVCFYKPLADLTGNVACGLYLSHLLQLQRGALLRQHVRTESLRVSRDDVSIALRLGPKVQRNARERLRAAGLIEDAGPSLVRLNLPAIMACLQARNDGPSTRGREASQPPPSLSLVPAPKASATAIPWLAAGERGRAIDGARIAPLQGPGTQLPLGLFSLANVAAASAQSAETGTKTDAALRDLRALLGASPIKAAPAVQVAENAKLDRTRVAENAKLDAESAKLKLPKTQSHISITITTTTTTRTRGETVDTYAESGKPRRRRPSINSTPVPEPIVKVHQAPKNVDKSIGDLVYPSTLDPAFLSGVRGVLARAAVEHRQALLDELAGQLRTQGKTIHNPAGWLMGLIRNQGTDGGAMFAMAEKVAEEREQRQRVQHLVELAARGGATPVPSPEPAQPADPVVRREALRKLTALRAAMAAKGGAG